MPALYTHFISGSLENGANEDIFPMVVSVVLVEEVRVRSEFRDMEHYPEYREVNALEVMTMALLYDLTHKVRLPPDYLRCVEPNDSGGRVCVGLFSAVGLEVIDGFGAGADGHIGRALARKLQT